jgi:hypothetical protein
VLKHEHVKKETKSLSINHRGARGVGGDRRRRRRRRIFSSCYVSRIFTTGGSGSVSGAEMGV